MSEFDDLFQFFDLPQDEEVEIRRPPKPNPQRKLRCILWSTEIEVNGEKKLRVCLRTDWQEEFKDKFKTLVPAAFRAWNDQTKLPPKVWHFDPSWIEQVYELCTRFFEVTVLDASYKPEEITDKSPSRLVESIEALKIELHLTALGERKIEL